jgi:hypothetical protein
VIRVTKQTELENPLMNDSTPRRVQGFTLEQFDNEILLFNVEKDETLYLNATAAMIWSLCDGEHTVSQLIELVAAAYPDSAANVEHDLHETLQTLLRHGAIEFS